MKKAEIMGIKKGDIVARAKDKDNQYKTTYKVVYIGTYADLGNTKFDTIEEAKEVAEKNGRDITWIYVVLSNGQSYKYNTFKSAWTLEPSEADLIAKCDELIAKCDELVEEAQDDDAEIIEAIKEAEAQEDVKEVEAQEVIEEDVKEETGALNKKAQAQARKEEKAKAQAEHKAELEKMQGLIVEKILDAFPGAFVKVNTYYKAIRHPKGKILAEVHAKGDYCRMYIVDPLEGFEESELFNRHDGSYAWSIRRGYEIPLQFTDDILDEAVRLFGGAYETQETLLAEREAKKRAKSQAKKSQKKSNSK